jgi:surface polysaccharide O-acyltransferase-like enzyme
MSSIGFLYIGIRLRDVASSSTRGVMLVILGFGLQIIEAQTLNYFFPEKSLLKFQFLIGTVFFAIGIFDLARSIFKDSFIALGKLGARHSLSIYIFHPYFIFAFSLLPLTPFIADLIIIPSVFLLSLLFSMFLDKYVSNFYKIVNGNLSFMRKGDTPNN